VAYYKHGAPMELWNSHCGRQENDQDESAGLGNEILVALPEDGRTPLLFDSRSLFGKEVLQ
jgi:hypothetical protein